VGLVFIKIIYRTMETWPDKQGTIVIEGIECTETKYVEASPWGDAYIDFTLSDFEGDLSQYGAEYAILLKNRWE
jgi:hypothetical protein